MHQNQDNMLRVYLISQMVFSSQDPLVIGSRREAQWKVQFNQRIYTCGKW